MIPNPRDGQYVHKGMLVRYCNPVGQDEQMFVPSLHFLLGLCLSLSLDLFENIIDNRRGGDGDNRLDGMREERGGGGGGETGGVWEGRGQDWKSWDWGGGEGMERECDAPPLLSRLDPTLQQWHHDFLSLLNSNIIVQKYSPLNI